MELPFPIHKTWECLLRYGPSDGLPVLGHKSLRTSDNTTFDAPKMGLPDMVRIFRDVAEVVALSNTRHMPQVSLFPAAVRKGLRAR